MYLVISFCNSHAKVDNMQKDHNYCIAYTASQAYHILYSHKYGNIQQPTQIPHEVQCYIFTLQTKGTHEDTQFKSCMLWYLIPGILTYIQMLLTLEVVHIKQIQRFDPSSYS